MKKTIICLILSLAGLGVNSLAASTDQSLPSKAFMVDQRALVTRVQDGSQIRFEFQLATKPEAEMLTSAIERYKKIDGFQNLEVREDRFVILTTSSDMSSEHANKLLLSSTRLFGYIGFDIKS